MYVHPIIFIFVEEHTKLQKKPQIAWVSFGRVRCMRGLSEIGFRSALNGPSRIKHARAHARIKYAEPCVKKEAAAKRDASAARARHEARSNHAMPPLRHKRPRAPAGHIISEFVFVFVLLLFR